MNIGQRIKKARESKGKTLLEVANNLGVTEATVQRYESGNIKNLKLDTISEIAMFLKVSPAYLMGWKDSTEDFTRESNYTYYPVSISAGSPFNVDGITKAEEITIPDAVMGKWAGSEDICIMRVNGDSMNKVIPDQSLIAVKEIDTHSLKSDDIVVFSNDNDYSVKRFFDDEVNEKFIFSPESTDRSFTDYTVDYRDAQDLKIHGKVVLYIVEMD